MGLFETIKAALGRNRSAGMDISICELLDSLQELQVRQLCFDICVNMIANALSRCEFRTYSGGEEKQSREYYLWNISPNENENSAAFLHHLVDRLYRTNEALVVETRKRGGLSSLVVADSFSTEEAEPWQERIYRDVTVGEYTFPRAFRERDVLHLRLHQRQLKPVLDSITTAYTRLIALAEKRFGWQQGQHMKVHVAQLAQGGSEWAQNFQTMINEQLRPFFENDRSVLPEFDGYTYTEMGGSGNSPGYDGALELRKLIADVWSYTTQAFMIPQVLINGEVENTSDALKRWLTNVIDPLCDQLQEEINRKRYGLSGWEKGDQLRIDSSSIIHFDLFANANSVEKLIGSGAFSINDVRRAAGQAPIPEGWADQYYMTLNMGTLDNNLTVLSGGEGGDNT